METATRFDRMRFRYTYTADSGEVLSCEVQGGKIVVGISDDMVSQEDVESCFEYALEQWEKARAAYLEEAQEQELADRIARNRGEE